MIKLFNGIKIKPLSLKVSRRHIGGFEEKGKLDFLIVGEKPDSSKIEKAKKLNVKMISEDEFMAMLT